MRSTRRLTILLTGAVLLTSALGSGAAAQDPSETPGVPQTCGVLSADEVSAALGMTLTVASGDGVDCEFDADFEKLEFLSLFTSMDAGSAAEIKDILCSALGSSSPDPSAGPCAIDLTIGGHAATYLPDGMGTLLYIENGNGGLLLLQLVGDPSEDVDKQAAMTSLGELAVARAAGIALATLPPDAPLPSFTSDAALEALFPTDIAGQAITVQSLSGPAITEDVPQEFLDALAGIGKSAADVSIGFAYGGADSAISITALQVDGADMAALKPQILPALFEGQEFVEGATVQLGGKDVISATADDAANYLYPHGDVLWLVVADEPALTEIFQKLP
jgi:hypothetical protein